MNFKRTLPQFRNGGKSLYNTLKYSHRGMDKKKLKRRIIQLTAIFLIVVIIPSAAIGEALYSLSRLKNYSDLPLEENRLITADNIPLQVWYSNTSTSLVVVVHGHFDNSRILYERTKNFFSKRGYDVLYLDLRNHGRSGKSVPTTLGIKESQDIVTLLKWLEHTTWKNVVLFGTSMGAVTVLLGYLRYSSPIVRGLVLDSFFYNIRETADRNLKKDFVLNPWRFFIVLYLFEIRGRDWKFPNLLEKVSELNIPTLISRGTEDIVGDKDVLNKVNALDNPAVSTVSVQGGIHSKLFDNDAYSRTIDTFVTSLFEKFSGAQVHKVHVN